MVITWPEDDARDTTDDIRDAIGRDIEIYVSVSGIACTVCDLDPITNLATDPFCPECNGDYWLSTASAYTVKAHVTHADDDTPVWVTGGTLFTGDTRVQIKYTASSVYAVNNAEYYMVDGNKYFKKSITERGVPNINRILISLEQQDG